VAGGDTDWAIQMTPAIHSAAEDRPVVRRAVSAINQCIGLRAIL
jgi:hypothetical protein